MFIFTISIRRKVGEGKILDENESLTPNSQNTFLIGSFKTNLSSCHFIRLFTIALLVNLSFQLSIFFGPLEHCTIAAQSNMLFSVNHRRRINTEEKAKVVAAAWGKEFFQFLAILHQDDSKKMMNRIGTEQML